MDYLVISDIHLGHEVYVQPTEAQKKRIDLINENLSIFLDRHTERFRELGKTCTLVLLGDVVDFCKASFAFTEADKSAVDWSDAAEHDGLAVTERNMAWKLRKIALCHAPIFEAFARFLGEGNRMVVVSGNHDSMFYWPGVCRALEEAIAQAGRGIVPANVVQSIEFRHWFYYEPGLFYMEHGHRFDPLSTSEYPLLPTDLYDPGRIFLPMNLLTIQLYAQNYYGLTAEQVTSSTVGELLGSAQASQVIDKRADWAHYRLARMYFGFIWTITKRWFLGFVLAQNWRWRDNEVELRRVARASGLPVTTMRALYALNVMPFETSLGKMMQLFCFDLLLIILAFVVVFPLGIWLALQHHERLLALAFVAELVPLTIALVWARYRGRKGLLDHTVDVKERIAKVAELVRVPAVVIGHTHVMSWSARDNEKAVLETRMEELGDEAPSSRRLDLPVRHLVLNSGTWEVDEGCASFLHFAEVAGSYRVRSSIWNLQTQEELQMDELPLRRLGTPRTAAAAGATRQAVEIGPRLASTVAGGVHRLAGVLDRSARLERLLGTGARALSLDLGGVTRVTSSGIAAWVSAMRSMPSQTRLTLMRCPPRLVAAFRSTLDALPAHANVVSFYEPRTCTACGKTTMELRVAGEVDKRSKHCSCGVERKALLAEADGSPFAFLESVRGRVRFAPGAATAWVELAGVRAKGHVLTLSTRGASVVVRPESTNAQRTLLGASLFTLQLLLPSVDGPVAAAAAVRWKRVALDGAIEIGVELTDVSAVCGRILADVVAEASASEAA